MQHQRIYNTRCLTQLFFFIIAALIMLVETHIAHAEPFPFQYNFEIKKHIDQKKVQDKDAEIKIENGQSSVILEPTRMSVRRGNDTIIYDFSDNTRTFIDHKNKKFIVASLYSVPAFMAYEKANRIMLAKMLQKAGIDKLKTDQFDLEMIFGGDIAGDIAKNIKFDDTAAIHKVTYEGEDVVSYEFSDRIIPTALSDIYKKYLTYAHQLHPVIVNKLVENGKILKSLQYRIKQEVPSLTESSYTLSPDQNSKNGTINIPEDYEEYYAFNDALNQIIQKSKTIKEKSVDEYIAQMNSSFEKQEYIEVVLKFLEYTMHLGSKDFEKIKPTIQHTLGEALKQSEPKALYVAITRQPTSKEEALKAIKIIEDAQSKLGANGIILNVYIANYYANMKQNEKAIKLTLSALEYNPFLTSAYKDLGDKYFKSFDMNNAWICWNRMRVINSEHPNNADIEKYEQRLQADAPVYFQTPHQSNK